LEKLSNILNQFQQGLDRFRNF